MSHTRHTRHRHRIVGLLALVLGASGLALVGLGATAVVAPAPAQAASTYLCTTYAGCRDAGYGTAGYAGASDTSYWRMYPGHNCTNYVAYRMVRNGMANSRPWSSTGSGNATYWGRYKKRQVSSRPMVGAVAWWKAGDGVGSAGHVAYVEQVVSRKEIVISEDSWSGTFHWRRLTKDGTSGWPTGFIHLNDLAVTLASKPTVSGDPRVGVPFEVEPGTTRPASARVRYRWMVDGELVPGGRGRAVTPPATTAGDRLVLEATYRARGYEPRTVRVAAGEVQPGRYAVRRAPRVSGTPKVDRVLTLDPGSYSPAPGSVAIAWYADGEPIPGAHGTTLRLGQGSYGDRVRAVVTLSGTGYTTRGVGTERTQPVRAGRIRIERAYTMGGRPWVGRALHVGGAARPGGVTVHYRWLRDGKVIRGAEGREYRPTGKDVGHAIRARLRLTAPGYLARTVEVSGLGRVLSTPTLKVTPKPSASHTKVKVAVSAPGVKEATGRVTATSGKHTAVGTLADGVVTLALGDLPAGKRRVLVVLEGWGSLLDGRVSVPVKVPRH